MGAQALFDGDGDDLWRPSVECLGKCQAQASAAVIAVMYANEEPQMVVSHR